MPSSFGDVTPPRLRHSAFALLSASMGLGFGVGPLLGGWLADVAGHAPTYVVSAVFALIGMALAQWSFAQTMQPPTEPGARATLREGLGFVARSPSLKLVIFANMMAGMTFMGPLGTFLPLHGKELGISQTAIGGMFAVRSCVSAFGRLPSSVLVRKLGNHPFLLIGLVCDALAMFGIWAAQGPVTMLPLLALDGLAYGGFMVAGQTFVAASTTDRNRGTVGGIYAIAAGVSGVVAPYALGVVAHRRNLRAVFAAAGLTLSAGVLLFGAGLTRLRRLELSR